MSQLSVVQASHADRVLDNRLQQTTEAVCPYCNTVAVYRHIDSHYSMGQWHGCKHIRYCSLSDAGLIESVEFGGATA